MEFSMKICLPTLLACLLLADVATPLRIAGAQLNAGRGQLTGVFRATYKEPRPVRSASRNLARAEATMNRSPGVAVSPSVREAASSLQPESDARVSRSSHQTPLLVTRLLEEHAGHEQLVERTPSATHAHAAHAEAGTEVAGVEYTRTLHPISASSGDHDEQQHPQPFSFQQYELDTSRQEHDLQEIDGPPGDKVSHSSGDGDGGGGKYEFVYQVGGVHGEGDYGHAEARDDAGKTWGRYYVHQPDGKVKTVRYWADHSGYHAQVEYHAAAGGGGGGGGEGAGQGAPEVHEESAE